MGSLSIINTPTPSESQRSQLRPAVLEREGLVGAFHLRLAAVEGRANIHVSLLADEALRLPPEVEAALYQIAQEALNNTLRHASATSVTVTLRQAADDVELEICDSGHGFAPDAPRNGGMGLDNMQARTEALGGMLVLRSAPGQGTTVQVTVPGGHEGCKTRSSGSLLPTTTPWCARD